MKLKRAVRLYGSNQLSEPPREPAWRKILGFIAHPMALLLWMAGVIALWLGEPTLGVIIWIVVLVNAAFSYWREYRAEQATAALQHLLPSYARVIRDGVEVKVSASELVAGDLLVLAEGDNIPADARVVEEYGLRTNNSVLTGEAVPARKTADASLRDGISEVERPNLVFAGTSVVSGTGRAVVYATGHAHPVRADRAPHPGSARRTQPAAAGDVAPDPDHLIDCPGIGGDRFHGGYCRRPAGDQ